MTFLNLGETKQWLDIVYGDTPGYLHICSTGDWDGKAFQSGDTETALRYINYLDTQGREGIYARACTLRQQPIPGRRGGDEQSFYLPGLWADIDIAGPGHKTTRPLPPDEGEAMRIVEAAGLPAPSHWIHSGGGLYAWWLLYDAIEIDDLEAFRALSSGWQRCLEAGAAKLGYFYGSGVGDLSRVLRVPGTVNRKAGLERPCAAFHPHAWSGDRFTLEQLHDALVEATPPPPEPPQLPSRPWGSGEIRPGDAFNEATEWSTVLPGWTWVYRRGDKWHLRRPGKDGRGVSATISLTTDRFYPFTDAAAPFEPLKHYSKFEAYALLEHGGDYAAAASALAGQGFGSRPDPFASGVLAVSVPATVSGVAIDAAVETQSAQGVALPQAAEVMPCDSAGMPIYSPQIFNRMRKWNGLSLADAWVTLHESALRYVGSDKTWMHYDGKIWNRADKGREQLATQNMVARMVDYADSIDDDDIRKNVQRELKRSTYSSGIASIITNARSRAEIASSWDEFDFRRNLVTVENGVLDLENFELRPHDHRYMLTKKINAAYDPEAKEGRFIRFMEEVLPDQEVREYLQRVCGYALTGQADERVLVQLYGPSGTGKSQFTKAVFSVMGDFAKRASESAFQSRPTSYKGPSEDLHSLMGSRFAMLPELDEGFRLNVSLIKALTGGDSMTTRQLYGQEVTWRPEYTIFMITNHLPRVSAGEDAYWNRVKPILFNEVFVDFNGEALQADSRNLGEKMAAEEPEVILNWLLEGLKNYRERGLDAPQQIANWRDNYRDDVDSVRQFTNEAPDEGRIEFGEDKSATVREMHRAYNSWCTDNGVPALGMRKFNERMEMNGFKKHRRGGGYTWVGLGVAGWLVENTQPALSTYRGKGRWGPE